MYGIAIPSKPFRCLAVNLQDVSSITSTQHSFMEPFNIYLKAWKHETIQQ